MPIAKEELDLLIKNRHKVEAEEEKEYDKSKLNDELRKLK